MYRKKRSKPFPAKKPVKIRLKPHKPFLQRHSWWLPVLGAAVVAATYLINQAMIDRYKEMVSLIDRTRDLAFVRGDLMGVARTIQSLRVALGSEFERQFNERHEHTIRRSGDKRIVPNDEAEQGYVSMLNDEGVNNLDSIRTSVVLLANTVRLLDTLSYRADEHQQGELLKKLGDLYERSISDGQLVNKGLDPAYAKRVEDALKSDNDQIRKLDPQPTILFGDRVQMLTRKVMERAEMERALAEERLKFWTRVSWFFYALGFALTLLGKKSSVDELFSAE